ncbi:OLC1v1031997C1 [Oldenlandia corymbosa var. corymbosa]|uniref:OLC1v1031997C1 n=1 Tax=Oldenlandia corymbosa var. corymbosa TaxID=529605 RepID=A0AAV1CK74_OLDCO|nr:OLC1v1031997C1 [Oldenlandia corymbosa var. corymbosa]
MGSKNIVFLAFLLLLSIVILTQATPCDDGKCSELKPKHHDKHNHWPRSSPPPPKISYPPPPPKHKSPPPPPKMSYPPPPPKHKSPPPPPKISYPPPPPKHKSPPPPKITHPPPPPKHKSPPPPKIMHPPPPPKHKSPPPPTTTYPPPPPKIKPPPPPPKPKSPPPPPKLKSPPPPKYPGNGIGSGEQCCSLLDGLTDSEAVDCLCDAIKNQVFDIPNLTIPVDINVVLKNCNRSSGFQCSSTPPPPPKQIPPPPPVEDHPPPPPASTPPPPPTSTPPPPSSSEGTCPLNVHKFSVCAGFFKDPGNGIGSGEQCCSLLDGLTDSEAVDCLCDAIKNQVFDTPNLTIPVDINVVLKNCNRSTGFQCSSTPPPPPKQTPPPPPVEDHPPPPPTSTPPPPPTSTPPPPSSSEGTCPLNVHKFSVCAGFFKDPGNVIGSGEQCCSLLDGLTDSEAVDCLCDAIKNQVFDTPNLTIPVDINVVLKNCNRSTGFQCSSTPPPPPKQTPPPPPVCAGFFKDPGNGIGSGEQCCSLLDGLTDSSDRLPRDAIKNQVFDTPNLTIPVDINVVLKNCNRPTGFQCSSTPPPPPKQTPPPPPVEDHPPPPPTSTPPPPPTSTPPPPSSSEGTCPLNVHKFSVCAGFFKDPGNGIGSGEQCCSLLDGLTDSEAVDCLCDAIKNQVFDTPNLTIPVDINVVLENCNRSTGFQCSSTPPPPSMSSTPPPPDGTVTL